MKLKNLAVLIIAAVMTVMLYAVGATVYSLDTEIAPYSLSGQPWNDSTKLPPTGDYYLNVDVTLTADYELSGVPLDLDLNGKTIDLDGHSIKLTGRTSAPNLTISGSGSIVDNSDKSTDGCIVVSRTGSQLIIAGTDITIENKNGPAINDTVGSSITVTGGAKGAESIKIIGSTYGIWARNYNGGRYITNATVTATSGKGILSAGELKVTGSTVTGVSSGIELIYGLINEQASVATVTNTTVKATGTDGLGISCPAFSQSGSGTVSCKYTLLKLRGTTKVYGSTAIDCAGATNITIGTLYTDDETDTDDSLRDTIVIGRENPVTDEEKASAAEIYAIRCVSGSVITVPVRGSDTNVTIKNVKTAIEAANTNITISQLEKRTSGAGNYNDNYYIDVDGKVVNTTTRYGIVSDASEYDSGYYIDINATKYGINLTGGSLTVVAGTVTGGYNGVRIASADTKFYLAGHPNITCSEELSENYSPTGDPQQSELYTNQVADIFLAKGDQTGQEAHITLIGYLDDSSKYGVWSENVPCDITETTDADATALGYIDQAWDDKRFSGPKSQYYNGVVLLDPARGTGREIEFEGAVYLYFDFRGNVPVSDPRTDVDVDNILYETLPEFTNPTSYFKFTSRGTLNNCDFGKDESGSPLPFPDAYTYAEGYPSNIDNFYRVGYIFEGWYSKSTGRRVYDPKSTTNFDSTLNTLIQDGFITKDPVDTLEAHWKLCGTSAEPHEWVYYSEEKHICKKCLTQAGHRYEVDYDATDLALTSGDNEDGLKYPEKCGDTGRVIYTCKGTTMNDGTTTDVGCEHSKPDSYTAPNHSYNDVFDSDINGHWSGTCTNELRYVANGQVETKTCGDKKDYTSHVWAEEWQWDSAANPTNKAGESYEINGYIYKITTPATCYSSGAGEIACKICQENSKPQKVDRTTTTVPHNYDYTDLKYLTEEEYNQYKEKIVVEGNAEIDFELYHYIKCEWFDNENHENCTHVKPEEHDDPSTDPYADHLDPTCMKQGYDRYHCNTCGQDVYHYIDIDETAHVWTTDKTNGWKTDLVHDVYGHWYTCTNTDDEGNKCGKGGKDYPETYTEHTFTQSVAEAAHNSGIDKTEGYTIEEESEATCKDLRVVSLTCDICSENSKDLPENSENRTFKVGDLAPHTYEEPETWYPYSSEAPSLTDEEKAKLTNDYHWRRCLVCSYVDSEKHEERGLNNGWNAYTLPDDETSEDYAKAYMKYVSEHWQNCSLCGDTVSKEHHKEQNGDILAPTCTEDGYTPYKCADCTATWKETIYKVPHEFTGAITYEYLDENQHTKKVQCKWYDDPRGCHETQDTDELHHKPDLTDTSNIKNYKPATCQAPGSWDYHCDLCDTDVQGAVIPINENNHAWVVIDWVEIEGIKGTTIDPDWAETDDNLDHDINGHWWYCTNEDEDGEVCGAVHEETYVKHEFKEANIGSGYSRIRTEEDIAATCTEPLKGTMQCDVCDQESELNGVEIGEELGHIYDGPWHPEDEDTTGKVRDGYHWRKCTRYENWDCGGIDTAPHVPEGEDVWHYEDSSGVNTEQHWQQCKDCGKQYGHEDHEFEWDEEYADPDSYKPDCSTASDGWQVGVCGVCGYESGRDIPWEHDFSGDYHYYGDKCLPDGHGEPPADLDADIDFANVHWQECKDCGAMPDPANEDDLQYFTEHSWEVNEDESTQPNCKEEADGYYVYDDCVCGKPKDSEVIPFEHNYTEWVPDGDTPASGHWHICTNEYDGEICGATESEDIEEHNRNKYEIKPDDYYDDDHPYKEGYVWKVYICDKCEYEVEWEQVMKGDEDGHHFRWTCLLDQDGSTDDLKNMDSKWHWHICEVCGFEVGRGEEEAGEHTGAHIVSETESKIVVIREATKTEEGLARWYCTANEDGCEYYELKTIPKLDDPSQPEESVNSSRPNYPPTTTAKTTSASSSVTPDGGDDKNPEESTSNSEATTPSVSENDPTGSGSSNSSGTSATDENGNPIPGDDPTVHPPTTSGSGNDHNGGDVGNGGSGNGRPSIDNSFDDGISNGNGAGSPGTNLGSGRVIVGVESIGDAPDISISFKTAQQLELESINKHISDDEKATIRNGVDMYIILTIMNLNKELDLTDMDRQLADTFLANSTYNEGQYLDLSIIKYMNNEQVGRIFQLDEPIAISLRIPEVLRKANRSFAVVRIHSGSADLLYDLDNDPDTITMLTDKFSTYVIVYRDYTPGEEDANANNPNTGIPWEALSMLAFAFPVTAMTYVFSKCRVR